MYRGYNNNLYTVYWKDKIIILYIYIITAIFVSYQLKVIQLSMNRR